MKHIKSIYIVICQFLIAILGAFGVLLVHKMPNVNHWALMGVIVFFGLCFSIMNLAYMVDLENENEELREETIKH